MRGRNLVLGVAAVVAAVVAAIGANAALDSGSSAPSKAQSVNPLVASHFALFRSEAGADGAAPAQRSQDDSLAREAGMNPQLARASQSVEGDTVIAAPTRDGACLGTERFGLMTCGSAQEAVDGTIVAAIVCSPHLDKGQVAVFALVPDGVAAVRGLDAQGDTMASYPVVNNTVGKVLPKTGPLPDSIEYSADNSTVRVRSQIPTGRLGC